MKGFFFFFFQEIQWCLEDINALGSQWGFFFLFIYFFGSRQWPCQRIIKKSTVSGPRGLTSIVRNALHERQAVELSSWLCRYSCISQEPVNTKYPKTLVFEKSAKAASDLTSEIYCFRPEDTAIWSFPSLFLPCPSRQCQQIGKKKKKKEKRKTQ